MGNIHVANGSNREVRVHIGHQPIKVAIIDSYGKVGEEPYKLEGGVGTAVDMALEEAGIVKVGPQQALPFDPDLAEDAVYVTIVTVDSITPIIMAYNNRLPGPGMSILLAANGSLQLSRPCGKFWKTKTGICYEHITEKPRPLESGGEEEEAEKK